MMSDWLLLISLLFYLIKGVNSDSCYNSWYEEYHECDYGCCGNSYDYGCCSIVGTVCGAISGGLFFLAFIIAAACCCIIKKGLSGRIINPTHTTQNTTVVLATPPQYQLPVFTTGMQYTQMPSGYPDGTANNYPQPPAYSQNTQPNAPPGYDSLYSSSRTRSNGNSASKSKKASSIKIPITFEQTLV